MRNLVGLALVSGLLMMGVPSYAAPITTFYSFSGSNFNPGWSTLTGDLTVTFDPAVDVTAGTLDSINLVIGSHIFTTAETRFDFFAPPPIAGSDKLIVYGLASGASLCFNCWDIRLVIDFASTASPVLSQFSFTPNVLVQQTATTRSVISSVVPEATTILLLACGLVGVATRQRGLH
ncbi:MAG: hypothetical protein GY946_03610 [bacterium]|nr:hypothetical protein [bacterium]